ncbi:DNA polymerase [Modicisalibacter xianhensis]|uniref:DNA polymerase n=1 Tax=Modicisalibacter xianhensis TaxID=442341 RepID=A0A4R8F877_9GAMM|nr:hypothetical protein [Halomonas xianhensis]TDX21646.1 DNA polymerase [Halomonas xianhensis]
MSDSQYIPEICTLDVETRSTVDLRKTGPWPYAEHPTTDLWVVCWAIGDGPTQRWYPGDPVPPALVEHLKAGHWFEFWNADFEHAIWSRILTPRYSWPELPIGQISDGMIRACVMGLPRSLEACGAALKMPVQKDKEGHGLMMRMAKPRKPRKDEDPGALLWWDDEERVERLSQYCERDVEVQRDVGKRLRHLTPLERDWFLRTTRMNARGVRVDTEFVDRAIACMDVVSQQHKRDIARLTDGAVTSPTQVANIKKWLADQGCELESLDKNLVAEMVETGDVPTVALPILEIRAQGGKSSVSKLPAFQKYACADGRVRSLFIHHGAGKSGRDAGAGPQAQNLPSRGGLPWQTALEVLDIVMRHGPREAVELIDMLYAPTPTALSSCLRSVLQASEGQRMYCADYSNIEGRFAAWLAGEQWKLDAFRAFDDGSGHDLYIIAAAGILGCKPEEVAKVLRNSLGKVSELSLQFQGGVGAFLSMAKNYRVEIGDHWDVIREAAAPSVIERTLEAWDARGRKSGTPEITWKAAEAVKVAWRDKHPAIVQAWYEFENAAVAAIRNPGSVHMVCDGRAGFSYRDINGTPFLMERLPSGRFLYLAYPWIEMKPTPWGSEKASIRYWGVDPVTKKWGRQSTYAGDLFQSAVQGGARDIMMHGGAKAEDKGGYAMLLRVHDEIAAEHTAGDIHEFERLMCDLPGWAAGLPVTAEGYVADRYRKD